MFTHLMSSKPPQERRSAAAATATSLIFHGLAIAGLVWATIALPKQAEQAADQVTLIRIEPEAPPPPPPPPPPPETRTTAPPASVNVPKGFLTLTPPTVVPPDIPPPQAGPTINAADFTGEGVEGGRANGKPTTVSAEDVTAAPVFTPYTVAPELRNRAAVQQALVKNYPPLLRDAGLGGTTLVWLLIDEHGKVLKTVVKQPSVYRQLDEAALRVADMMVFSPGMNRDQKVKVWVALPFSFTTK